MNSLFASLEDYKKEEEVEFGFFLHLTDEQLAEVIETLANNQPVSFSESKLPTENGLYSRLRHYLGTDEQPETFIYTVKEKKVPDEGGATTNQEHNTTLERIPYLAMMQLTTNTVIRTRYKVPFYRDGEPIIRKNGDPLQWEVDIYVDGRNGGNCSWIKVDLEVDNSIDIDVTPYIPVPYEEIIAANSKNPEDRAMIDNLYANIYPVPKPA